MPVFRNRGAVTGTALLLAFALGLTSIACTRGPERGRVLVLGIDGLEPSVIDTLLSEGSLPAFAELRRGGAYGRLESMKPMLSPILWTTVATGRSPADHRIGHFVAVNPQTGDKIPVTSQMRSAKALWNIASEAGLRTAAVGWWATWPAESVRGTIVSDHACYHFLFGDAAHGPRDPAGIVSPQSRTDEMLSMVRRPGDITTEELARFADLPASETARPFDFNDDGSHLRWAIAAASSYARIGEKLWREDRPDLGLVYVEGVDSTSHLFGHLYRRSDLAGELAEQQRRFGRTVEEMYRYADEIVATFLDLLGPNDTLVLLSDHGFDLGAAHGDPSKTRDLRRVSEKFHRVEGVLYLYGRGVRRYTQIDRPKLYDIAPTVLALLGLPASDDMPGRVLTDALTLDVIPERIATYETDGSAAIAGAAPAPVDPAILRHLESLGYLDTESPTGDRNLAAMLFEDGRYTEAAAAFKTLIAATPDDGALRASYAGALGALGRYDEALEQLEDAERLTPIHPEVHHNRGVIYERQGRIEQAVAAYTTAVRYDPDYLPSKTALLRLTGNESAMAPTSDAERSAAALAERAAEAAKRGDYAAATDLLDQATNAAPGYALVVQYRANVAFLAGDRAGAIAALEKGLQMEPDNALFLQNLRYLRSLPREAPREAPIAPGRD